eukprot:721722_1
MKKYKLAIFALVVAFFGSFALCGDFSTSVHDCGITIQAKVNEAFNSGMTIAEIDRMIEPFLTKSKDACKLDAIADGIGGMAEYCPGIVDDYLKNAKDDYLALLT